VSTAAGGPDTAPPVTAAETAAPPQLVQFLERSERAEVLTRNGLGAGALTDLFRRLCDEFKAGTPVEELFVKYSDEVAGRSAMEGAELRAAFADAFGAGVPALCPEAVPEGEQAPPG
jgi:hypothetical protein